MGVSARETSLRYSKTLFVSVAREGSFVVGGGGFEFGKLATLILTLVVVLASIPLATFTTPGSSVPTSVLSGMCLSTLTCANCSIRTRGSSNAVFIGSNDDISTSVHSGVNCNANPSKLRAMSDSDAPSNGTPSVSGCRSRNLYYTSCIDCICCGCVPGMTNVSASNAPYPSGPESTSTCGATTGT